MTNDEKKAIIASILQMLDRLSDDSEQSKPQHPVEMLTITECTELVRGLSAHTVRRLVAQNKVKHFRTGEGKRGKILVNMDDLLAFLQR